MENEEPLELAPALGGYPSGPGDVLQRVVEDLRPGLLVGTHQAVQHG